MLIYDLASVEDRGSYWSVSGVQKNALDTADREGKYLKLSDVAAKLIKDALVAGDEVRITKPLTVDEVLPNEVKVIKIEESDLSAVQESNVKRVRMLINHDLASVSGLAFYGFMCLNNELADKGFFITEENRESKYLEILETGDEKFIQKLEDYLNYKDEIARVSALHNKFTDFRKEVYNETCPDKIVKCADDFMDDFYTRF